MKTSLTEAKKRGIFTFLRFSALFLQVVLRMSNELAAKLARRCQLNEDKSGEKDLGAKLSCNYRSVYAGRYFSSLSHFQIFFRIQRISTEEDQKS